MINKDKLKEMFQHGWAELDKIEGTLSNSENFDSHTSSFIENRKNDLHRFASMIAYWVTTDKQQILFTPTVYNEISSEINAIINSAKKGSI